MLYELAGIVKVKMFGNVSQMHGAWHNRVRLADNIVLYCTEGEIHMQLADDPMLLETNLSSTEIAEQVGFSDIYYFSRIFKQFAGISPSKIRSRK